MKNNPFTYVLLTSNSSIGWKIIKYIILGVSFPLGVWGVSSSLCFIDKQGFSRQDLGDFYYLLLIVLASLVIVWVIYAVSCFMIELIWKWCHGKQ